MPRLKHWPVDLLGDRPLADVAKLMGLSEADLSSKLAPLVARGFPQPDSTTGMIDLDAVVQWRRMRHPSLFGLINHQPGAQDAGAVLGERLKRMREDAQRRKR